MSKLRQREKTLVSSISLTFSHHHTEATGGGRGRAEQISLMVSMRRARSIATSFRRRREKQKSSTHLLALETRAEWVDEGDRRRRGDQEVDDKGAWGEGRRSGG